MRNIRELLTDTRKWKNLVGTDIENNAKQVMLFDWKVVEAMDVDGDTFRDVTVKARSKRDTGKNKYGPVHIVEFRLYGDDNFTTKAWVSCSCPYFKFTAEVSLYKKDSSDIIFSNGADPNIKNPRQIPIVCKHILAAIRAGVVKRPVTKSLVKEQLEYEKKEKKRKELEKEKAKKEKIKERESDKKLLEKKMKEAEKQKQDRKKKEAENKRLADQKKMKDLREKERIKRERAKK
jgi:hypothetical protein